MLPTATSYLGVFHGSGSGGLFPRDGRTVRGQQVWRGDAETRHSVKGKIRQPVGLLSSHALRSEPTIFAAHGRIEAAAWSLIRRADEGAPGYRCACDILGSL